MKKMISILLLVSLGALLLAGCGPALPSGVTAEEMKTDGEAVVSLLNAKNYQAVVESYREDLRNTLKADDLEGIFGAKLTEVGEFKSFKKADVKTETSPDTKETVVKVQVNCEYAEGTAVYVVVFDKDKQLIGLYPKN